MILRRKCPGHPCTLALHYVMPISFTGLLFLLQSRTEHKGKEGLCSDLDNTVSLVIKTADGNVKSFSGSVVGGCPILLEICGAWFSSGGPWLKGNMVVYKGKATPAVFASVTGRCSQTYTCCHFITH